MTIEPREGYEVICDECGESELYLENPDYVPETEIDFNFKIFLEDLRNKGWVISDKKVLCPKCAKKEEVSKK
jgi:predicted nucleic-acid-binding Zn-ribbon protein